MDKEQIRQKLGLMPQSEVEEKARKDGVYPRRSGRTIEMLLDVLEVLSSGEKIILVGHRYQYAKDLKRKILDMAKLADIKMSASSINIISPQTWEELRYKTAGMKDEFIFVDHHTVIELKH